MRMPIAAALCAALIAATPAAARSDNLVVKYADLDLSSPAGQKTLERRISAAARKFCGADAQNTGTRMRSAGTSECLTSARDLARSEVVKATGATLAAR